MDNRRLYKLTFRIAGTNIEIQSPFRYHRDNFADFFTTLPADCKVLLTQDEVIKNRVLEGDAAESNGWEGYLSNDRILQKIADVLLAFDAILVHGAAISYNGDGYLFSAPSGTGKTTHIRLWLERLQDAYVVNGDKPFIRADAELQPMLCGSPWGGKEGMCSNSESPLKAIVFMRRADTNALQQITFKEAFVQFFQQIYRPADQKMMHKTLSLLQRIGNSDVTFWQFSCNNFSEDCFPIAYETLTGRRFTEKEN